jgi:hypothetical protein
MSMKDSGLVPVQLDGGKRTNIGHASDANGNDADWNWWVGWGKDDSCQFEGPWQHMAILAAKILRHPNTKAVCPNLFVELPLTPEQEESY